MEIRRRLFVSAYASGLVTLSPDLPGSESLPKNFPINQVRVSVTGTPPADFWGAAGQCRVYEVIIRQISK